ncbi:MAG: hypothetical protein P8O70_08410 [SAR324 cluster bacterium]|nr:hypothetical protein [SAR324 cluster bacterium]
MESILKFAQEQRFIDMTTTFERPEAVGGNYLEELRRVAVSTEGRHYPTRDWLAPE